MKKILSANITRYRKQQKITQQELAKKLNISYQAVSKWETGQTTPDLTLLPAIASILQISIDQLMGYTHSLAPETDYEQRYQTEEYYWGVEPSQMCLKLVELMPPIKPLKVLDIGCGEGKDAVFLARCGYQVSAFDITDAGIEKTKRLADKAGVFVEVFKANIQDFRLEQDVDILYSSGVFHYILPELRTEIIENYRQHTSKGGLNAFNVFVEKPFIDVPPEKENRYPWKSGELFTMYYDWLFEECREVVFDCNSSGIPHKHAMDILIAHNL